MRSVIGVITARMASTRLPGKVMKPLAGKTIFAHHVERMRAVGALKGVCLATSVDPKNRALIQEAERLDCSWYAGPEEDIVERHVKLCEQENADAVIRVTCDCPLFNIDISSEFVRLFKSREYDFISCGNMPMMQGTLTELISCRALQKVHESYRGPAISLPIREKLTAFSTTTADIQSDLVRPEYRLTVDEPADYLLMEHIYNELYRGLPIPLGSVYTWLDDNPEIAKINQHVSIKGVNRYVANLMEKPLYSVVKSGEKYVVLDEKKQIVPAGQFLAMIQKMTESEDLI
jgi:spore coat polysaccharide biosynthesis protein SpsF